ncbi:MAG: MFS transporter [Planctomycetota bacterium]|nr:MFS transporter [Planctomycetota bacterium]
MARLSKQEVAWALYDWAASAFALCVLAGFFPVLFQSYWARNLSASEETFWYGILVAGASLVGAILAPWIGTLADSGQSRKKWLFCFALLGMCCTCGLILVGRNHWPLAGAIFMIGTIGYYGAFIAYNSLLPCVSPPGNRHLVSGLGFALGYLGGVILFVVSIVVVKNFATLGLASETAAVHLTFIAAAIWWLVFTLPLLLLVHEPHRDATQIPVATYLHRLLQTLREISQNRSVIIFLIAYWLYIDGVNTVVSMASNYGKTLGFSTSTMLGTLILAQVVGVPSTLLVTYLASKFRALPFLFAGIALYLFTVGYAAVMPTTPIKIFGFPVSSLYVLGFLVGCAQGGIQALSRSTFSLLIPPGRTASYFGVYNMLGQYAALLGPLAMALVTRMTGSPRWGVASIALLFLGGGIMLTQLGHEEGKKVEGKKLEGKKRAVFAGPGKP